MAKLNDLRSKVSEHEWEAIIKFSEELAATIGVTEEQWIANLGITREQWITKSVTGIEEAQRSEVAALRIAKENGWDTDFIKRAFIPINSDGNIDGRVIQELGQKLYVEIGVHKVLENKGETHTRGRKVLPKSLIKYLAVRLLEACIGANVPPSPVLPLLIRDLLKTEGFGHSHVRTVHREKVAILFIANNPDASLSRISKASGADKATVSRWKNSPEFMSKVENLIGDDFERYTQNYFHDSGLPLPDDE
jgi:hypothetical protein